MKTLFWIRYTPKVKEGSPLKSISLFPIFEEILMVYNKGIPHALSICSEESIKGVFHYHILLFAAISDQGLRLKIKKAFPDFNKTNCYLKVKDDTQETIDYLHTYMLKGDPDHDFYSNNWQETEFKVYGVDHYINKWVNMASKAGKETQNQQKSAKFAFFLAMALEKIEIYTKKHFSRKIHQTHFTTMELFLFHVYDRKLYSFLFKIFARYFISLEKLWCKHTINNITNCMYLHILESQNDIDYLLDKMSDIEFEKIYEKKEEKMYFD